MQATLRNGGVRSDNQTRMISPGVTPGGVKGLDVGLDVFLPVPGVDKVMVGNTGGEKVIAS